MNKRLWTNVKLWIFVVTLLFLGVAAAGRAYLKIMPFSASYTFDGVSEVSAGASGALYVIDHGKKLVLQLDSSKRLIRKIDGGSDAADFFYATHVSDDAKGDIYISDINYGEEGNRILSERILLLSDGKRSVVYEKDYRGMEEPPLQYGNIYELKSEDGRVGFTVQDGDRVSFCLLEDGEITEQYSSYIGQHLSDAAFDYTTRTFAVTTRKGEIYTLRAEKPDNWYKVETYADGQTPWDVSCHNGKLYVTDLIARQIRTASLDKSLKDLSTEEFYSDDVLYYNGNITPDGSGFLLTDHESFTLLDVSSMESTGYPEVPIAFYGKIVVVWLCLVLALAGMTYFVILLLRRILIQIIQSPNRHAIIRVTLVAVSTIVVSLAISFSSIVTLVGQKRDSMLNTMGLLGSMMIKNIDVDQLMSIDPEPGAYRSAGYNAVKKPLDDMIDAGYDQGLYYYYVIYVPDGEDIRLIMDYEDAYTCGQPIYEYGENEYTKVLETGEKIVVADDISSYGSWMFVLLPLKDRRGHVVAELEVGTSADQLKKEGRRMIIENLCSILCTSAVVIMLLLELLFAMNFYEQRRKIPAKERQIMEVVPIRLLLFLSEGTDCMQDAFIAILCSKLYETSGHTGWLSMIPMGIAIALPMSLQLMMAAIASLLGGKLAQKYGTVRIMTIGFFTQIVGFFVCAVVGSAYEGILFGKILIGLGFGLIYVSANTMAAMGDGDKSAQAFTDVSAGVLSGVTIGVGLGSILLDLGNYQMVYLAGAILLTAGLLILLSTWKTASAAELLRTHASADMTKTGSAQNNMEEAAASAKKIGILQFMLDRQVITFFLLILTPFMMSLAYREYFFPLFVQNYGITEVQIGQIYLLCGLSTLYLGPLLAKILLNGIGAKKSILLASGLMAANMMMFVLKPTLFSALIGVGIFSVIISFAYTCQYTYFEDVPVVRWYGEGGSMGIYSMFESLGQTLGPMLYGVALGCGTRRGIFLIAAAMTVMMILFRFLNSERKQG